MENIKVEKPTDEKLEELGVRSWPIWTKEVSKFDWHYDDREVCYLLEGEVVVRTKDGEEVKFGKGDLVTFAKGLSCNWEVIKPVKKHYSFG